MAFKLRICCVLVVIVVLRSVYTKDLCKGKYENCICNEDYVACHNEEKINNMHTFITNIQDDVTFINITGSKHLKELPVNVFGSCKDDTELVLHKLRSVDLSNNKIEIIHGQSFHCIPHLTYLNLAHNVWRVDLHPDQIGYFTSMPMLKHLDLTNTFQEVWDGSLHMTKLASVFKNTNMTQLEGLYLGHNEFHSFSEAAANSFCELESLRFLNLSNNYLDSPSLPTSKNCMKKLESLDLSFNKMTVLPVEFMGTMENLTNLKNVYLDNNKYACDCGLIETWDWLINTKLPINKDKMICESGYHSSYIGKPLLSLERKDLLCLQLSPPSNVAVKVVTGIIFTVIGVTLIAFLIVNRARVKLVCKRVKQRLPEVRFRSHQGYASVQEVATI